MAANGATNRIATILASNIRLARTEKGLTQGAFGRLIGVENQQVSNWERGRGRPNDANLVRIAEVTNRDVAWFYTEHTEDRTAA